MTTGYDIIGDIHGHHDKLVVLLQKLGYRESDGTWRHPGRVAIFVGDLIDRGPKQVATVTLVRRMVDAGSARCIMGKPEPGPVNKAATPGDFASTYVDDKVELDCWLAQRCSR